MVPEARALSTTPGPLPGYQLHPVNVSRECWTQTYVRAAANARPKNLPDRAEMMRIFAIRLRDAAREVDFTPEG